MSQKLNNEIYNIYYRRYPYAFRFGSYLALVRSLTIRPLVSQLYQHSQLRGCEKTIFLEMLIY